MSLPYVKEVMQGISNSIGREPDAGHEGKHDPFRVLIGCILSLRTRDETTEPAEERLFALAHSPESMERLSRRAVEKAIYPVGFYRVKAKRILEICRVLRKHHDGAVPASLEGLLDLAGVGRKTANIVMLHGFGKPALPIDTHCHRIPRRLGWMNTRSPEETEKVLRKELPPRYWKRFNPLFVRFGQKICRPVGPRCGECLIERFCKKVSVKPGKSPGNRMRADAKHRKP